MAASRYRYGMWVSAACVVVAAHALIATALLVTWTPTAQPVTTAPLTVTLAMQEVSPTARVPLPQSQSVERPRTQVKPMVAERKLPEAIAPAQTSTPAQDTSPPDTQIPIPETAQTHAPQAGGGAAAQVRQVWYGEVLALLQKQKRYPRLALLRNEQGVVKVRFVVDRTGHLISVEMENSSGYQSLDREALALVQRVSPFPPPPASITGNHISLEVPIAFQVTQ